MDESRPDRRDVFDVDCDERRPTAPLQERPDPVLAHGQIEGVRHEPAACDPVGNSGVKAFCDCGEPVDDDADPDTQQPNRLAALRL